MKKRFIVVIFVMLLLIIFTSCGKVKDSISTEEFDEYGIKVGDNNIDFIDGLGREITIEKEPKRVVILFGSYIDIWLRNGGSLVGMIEDATIGDIPGIENVETVGKVGLISLEKIVSLEPDLVIVSSNSKGQLELIDALEQSSIRVLVVDYKVKDDYFKVVKLFSAINNKEELYDQNAKMIREDINDIIAKVPKENPPKVFIMFASSKSITSRGSDSTTGEMLKDLNTINIADMSRDILNDKSFSLEKLLEEDPDFIFVQTMGSDMAAVKERIREDVESNPAWSSLTAVKNGRYIFLPKDLYMYKANHRYAEAYKGLAEILYPEVFK